MINKDRILAEFFELVQITCNSRQEREIGDLMKKRLQDLGGEVIEDGAGAIIGGNCGNIIANFKKMTVQPMYDLGTEQRQVLDKAPEIKF